MSSILIKDARAVVTVDARDRVLENACVLIKDGRIESVGGAPCAADTVLDGRGLFVYPGLVNTHHHLYQTFTRNLPGVQRMELFDWLRALYEIWRGLDADCVYYSALTGMSELIKYGVTTLADHHYVFPASGSEGFIERQFEAAGRLGVRFTATRGSMSRGRSKGGLPPDELTQDVDCILRDSERLAREYHDGRFGSMRQVALAPCSPFSVDEELLVESARLARALGVRLHTHLCETLDEERYCLERLGMRPLRYMEKCGWLGKDVWFAHAIHLNGDELKLLSDTGTGVAHCPVSNMKLASGVCRVSDMLRLGVPVSLAVDGSASNDGSNLMAEMRAAYLLGRLNFSGRAPGGYDILKIATRGGARVLGRTDIGSIEPGMAADLFAVDVDRLEYVGARLDPKAFLATVGFSHPARYVIVNGRLICEDGRLTGIDERAEREKADRAMRGLLNKYNEGKL